MAADYLQDKSLQREAQVAVVRIAQGIYDNPAEKKKNALAKPVKELLEKVVKITKTDSIGKQAQELIKKYSALEVQVK